MTRFFSQPYLRCQLIGWSLMLVWLTCITYSGTNRLSGIVVWFQLIFCLAGLFVTHLLRNFIHRRHYRELPLRQAVPGLLLATTVAAVIGTLLKIAAIRSLAPILHPSRWAMSENVFAGTIQYLIVLIPWTTVYCLYFYVVIRRKLSLEEHRLKLLLKEKERSTAEPPVDVDFITGSLERIRSMIDEDPTAARESINTFSHMLRKGRLKTE